MKICAVVAEFFHLERYRQAGRQTDKLTGKQT